MARYEVVIRAIVTKTHIVEADDEDAAEEAAYQVFSITHDNGVFENYKEEVVCVTRCD
jgi:hypothetical protein